MDGDRGRSLRQDCTTALRRAERSDVLVPPSQSNKVSNESTAVSELNPALVVGLLVRGCAQSLESVVVVANLIDEYKSQKDNSIVRCRGQT